MKSLAASAALIAAVFGAATAFAADPAAGKKVAQGTCAVCHGLDGIAKNPDAPHLAAENVEYLMRQLKAFKTRRAQARADVHHRAGHERGGHGQRLGLVLADQDQGGDAAVAVL